MNSYSVDIESSTIRLLRGDITTQAVDAIVNAANSSLMGGGGVDGAIHRAGGPEILEECKKIVELEGRLKAGNAVITSGGRLKAKYVIHTVGPVWRGGSTNEEITLKNAYLSSLKLARQYEARSIAFPAISTGAYGYPVEKASLVAIGAVKQFVKESTNPIEIHFVLFDEVSFKSYKQALE